MPRIWIDYCQFLVDQCKVTRTRRTFDRALRALPITQHRRIWPLYLKFVRKYHIPETAVRVYRRYLKVCSLNFFQTIMRFSKPIRKTLHIIQLRERFLYLWSIMMDRVNIHFKSMIGFIDIWLGIALNHVVLSKLNGRDKLRKFSL